MSDQQVVLSYDDYSVLLGLANAGFEPDTELSASVAGVVGGIISRAAVTDRG